MSGALWAALAGIGFGLFQAYNRKAGHALGDAYRSTFILLLVSTLILAGASVFTEDFSLLLAAPPNVYLNFGMAGFIHFFLGWTFISISQERIGAARTGALVGTTPLFAAVVGFVFFDELLSLPTLLGMAGVIAGAYFVSMDQKNGQESQQRRPLVWRDSIFAMGTAVCFAASAIFIRAGLEDLPSPLLGVTVGMVISTAAYGLALVVRRSQTAGRPLWQIALLYQVIAGIFVGLSTWMRWIALDLAPVGVVLALGRLNIPTVLITAPLLVGRKMEHVTPRIWVGACLIIFGSLIIIYF